MNESPKHAAPSTKTGLSRPASLAFLIALSLIFACQAHIDAAHVEMFDGERALSLVEQQMDFGYRIPASEAHQKTGDWILAELIKAGWETDEQYFRYGHLHGRNIIGKAGRTGGDLILFGTHYDTRPYADRDPYHPDQPVPGANDGASGVAVLLELARVLQTKLMERSIWMVFFDLEDSGRIDEMEYAAGSTYFVKTLAQKPDAVVIVDMVGDADLQLYFEVNSDMGLYAEIWQLAHEHDFEAFISQPKYAVLDDHIPFIQLGIPSVILIDFTYPYWHTTEDTIDKIAANSLEQVGRTLQLWLAAR